MILTHFFSVPEGLSRYLHYFGIPCKTFSVRVMKFLVYARNDFLYHARDIFCYGRPWESIEAPTKHFLSSILGLSRKACWKSTSHCQIFFLSLILNIPRSLEMKCLGLVSRLWVHCIIHKWIWNCTWNEWCCIEN